MNLHEYQGKELLSSMGVAIQRGYVATTVGEAESAYQRLKEETNTEYCVVKAQIHAGGRGKGGGVKLAKNEADLRTYAGNILGMMLKTPQTPGGMEGPGQKSIDSRGLLCTRFRCMQGILCVNSNGQRNTKKCHHL